MRNKFLLLLLVAVSLGLKAQTDMFPDYSPESYDIALDYKAGEIKMFNVHAPNNICNSYMYYNVYGLKPTVGNRWIKTSGGDQNADETNTPPALLCRTLKAYASRDISQIKQLYRDSDAAAINQLLSVDSISERYMQAVSMVNKLMKSDTVLCPECKDILETGLETDGVENHLYLRLATTVMSLQTSEYTYLLF